MVSDEGLRAALSARTAHLAPDVEAELEAVFRRVGTRRRLRRSGYAVGLVAAVAAVILVGLDPAPRAEETPEPADDIPVQALVPTLGNYAFPAAIDPGRYRVDMLQTHVGGIRRIDIDVPPGWGQDDKYALATGPPSDSAARLDFFGKITRVYPDPCSSRRERVVGTRAFDVARSLASLERLSASRPLPVTIDGSAGYFVRLNIPSAHSAEACGAGAPIRMCLPESDSAYGWTELIWVLDVDGHQQVTISASHGPRATQARVAELTQMVESITLVSP